MKTISNLETTSRNLEMGVLYRVNQFWSVDYKVNPFRSLDGEGEWRFCLEVFGVVSELVFAVKTTKSHFWLDEISFGFVKICVVGRELE